MEELRDCLEFETERRTTRLDGLGHQEVLDHTGNHHISQILAALPTQPLHLLSVPERQLITQISYSAWISQ